MSNWTDQLNIQHDVLLTEVGARELHIHMSADSLSVAAINDLLLLRRKPGFSVAQSTQTHYIVSIPDSFSIRELTKATKTMLESHGLKVAIG
jgi:hypothetical protein